MTLYEIDSILLSLIDPETGELLDFEEFQKLQMDREEKIENMVLWYKELVAQSKAIKEEVCKLTERRNIVDRKAERLLKYISFALDGKKFSTARCAVSYRSTKAIEVQDLKAATDWLDNNGHLDMVTYSAPQIDKRAVKQLINQGVNVPGVEIVENKSLQIK